MNSKEKALARLMFKAQISRLSGMAFQNFFSDIMRYARPDFTPVKPQGNDGDWKNDGHEPKAGRYYQVYSPEKFDEAKAIKKLHEDFDGLIDKWGNASVYPSGVSEFYFVINDAYRVMPGSYASTISALEGLRQKHSLKECKPFLTKDLEEILLGLVEDQIISILGYPPNPEDIKVLNFTLVDEVIRHIIESGGVRSISQTLIGPDFEQKIIFNKLVQTSHWLLDAYYRHGSLEEYFRANSNFARQEIRDRLNAIYEHSKTLGFADTQNGTTSADQQLFYILNEITPTLPNSKDARLKKELQDAALVVMAYFFESCDIFEEPVSC